MHRVPIRLLMLFAMLLLLLGGMSCQAGKRFYPVRGQVFIDGKPAEGVTIVFHLEDDPDQPPTQPTAIVQADGSFELRSYLVKERELKNGAPPGPYRVTCVWYPADLNKYLGQENLPDKLKGKYADPKTTPLRAEVAEKPNELPAFQLELEEK